MSALEQKSPAPRISPMARRWVLGAVGLALLGVATGAPLAVGRFDSAVLLPLVGAFCFAFALVRWLRGDDPRGAAVSRARGSLERYGGGFYGTAALATWVYLGAVAIRHEWAASRGVRDFLLDRLTEWLPKFGVDSLHNTIRAATWPLFWSGQYGWGGMLAVAAVAWLVYHHALRLAPVRPGPVQVATVDAALAVPPMPE